MPAHLVSLIDVRDFGAETVRVGDLNGDGAPDLLFVQGVRGPRTITCLTAATIHGELLWQYGQPSADHGEVYCDLPVQVYDWDGDGRNEVLFVRQAEYLDVELRPDLVVERAPRYGGTATMVVPRRRDRPREDPLPDPRTRRRQLSLRRPHRPRPPRRPRRQRPLLEPVGVLRGG